MKNALIALAALIVLGVGYVVYNQARVSEDTSLGAQSQQVADGDCYLLNGNRVCPKTTGLNTASTTICSIKAPAATSTLESASARLRVSSTTDMILTFSKATNTNNATTTKFGDQITVAANAQDSVVASTTALNIEQEDHVFGPNDYFNVGAQGGIGTFSPSGSCSATFQVL
jgi:hypothetical protein